MSGAVGAENFIAGAGAGALTDCAAQSPKIRVYSRAGCHLCEVLVEELKPLLRGRLELEVCNIETCEKWQRRYGLRIPIVLFNGREICQFTLDKDAIGCIVAAELGSIKAS